MRLDHLEVLQFCCDFLFCLRAIDEIIKIRRSEFFNLQRFRSGMWKLITLHQDLYTNPTDLESESGFLVESEKVIKKTGWTLVIKMDTDLYTHYTIVSHALCFYFLNLFSVLCYRVHCDPKTINTSNLPGTRLYKGISRFYIETERNVNNRNQHYPSTKLKVNKIHQI